MNYFFIKYLNLCNYLNVKLLNVSNKKTFELKKGKPVPSGKFIRGPRQVLLGLSDTVEGESHDTVRCFNFK